MSTAPNTTTADTKVPTITLHIIATPTGVLLRADGDLKASHDAAQLAGILCRFAEGLFVGGNHVQLGDEIVEAFL